MKGKETLGWKISSARQTNGKLLVEEINIILLWTDHYLKGWSITYLKDLYSAAPLPGQMPRVAYNYWKKIIIRQYMEIRLGDMMVEKSKTHGESE